MSLLRDLPGIRIVRPLGRDMHRESWLVRLEGEQPGPAVLVRACDVPGARMVRVEASALDRGRGAGLAELIDVVDDPGGVALLREHCVGPRLAAVLGERERWQAGEAVTALQPVVTTLERLHGKGVAHGALSAAEILLGPSGGMLVDLGHAELFEPGAPEAVLAQLDAIGRDRDAVRSLACEVLRRVAGSRSHAAHELADALDQTPPARLLGALHDGLDELAAPLPLAHRDPPASAASVPHADAQGSRLMPVVRVAEETTQMPHQAARDDGGSMISKVRELRTRLDALPARRRRIMVAGAAALTAAAVLLALPRTPQLDDPYSSPGTEAPAPRPSGETAGSTAHSTAAEAAIVGDDPLAAVIALLERRDSCFAELSVLCLEEVNQQDSSAAIADRAAMQALRDGDEADIAAARAVDARLLERLGDSALVEVGPQTAPASILLMRSEAGWRIRDWVAGGVD